MAFGSIDPCSPNCHSCAAITSKPIPFCDYSMAMTEFAEALIKLHNHIEEHNLHVDAEDVCNEMKAAVDFLMDPEDFSWFAGNDKAWKAGWNFIRDNIRRWWD